MEELKKLIMEVNNYCKDNNIEYLFVAVCKEKKHDILANNVTTNKILKKALKTLEVLIW